MTDLESANECSARSRSSLIQLEEQEEEGAAEVCKEKRRSSQPESSINKEKEARKTGAGWGTFTALMNCLTHNMNIFQ